MIEVSGTVRPRASSRSTGILPTGHRSRKSALPAGSARSTRCAWNGVSFSYSAINTLWQNEARGCEYRCKDMAGSRGGVDCFPIG